MYDGVGLCPELVENMFGFSVYAWNVQRELLRQNVHRIEGQSVYTSDR